MKKYVMSDEEVVILETLVKYKKHNDVKLLLTNSNLIFEIKKGLFRKEYKTYDVISLESIKEYKDKVQIKCKKNKISMQTTNKDVSFVCKNSFEAKKIMEQIINVKTDSTGVKRFSNAVVKLGGVALSVVASIAALPKYKDEIVKYGKDIIGFFKK